MSLILLLLAITTIMGEKDINKEGNKKKELSKFVTF